MSEDGDADSPGLDIPGYLYASLDNYRSEHEETFAAAEGLDQQRLYMAMETIQRHALTLITRGAIPSDISSDLEEFLPGTPLDDKVVKLLSYNFVQDRLAFDVAWNVVGNLEDVHVRVRIAVLAFSVLLRASPSATAVKYLERAATLYLAGYGTEVFIMCGAMLEAAMASRFPDEGLLKLGWKPAYRHTGVFSLGQRMQYEEDHPLLDRQERQQFWQIINWRNDAVHVQPDLGPDAAQALLLTSWLLGKILPRSAGF
jgi:hypothetical protein